MPTTQTAPTDAAREFRATCAALNAGTITADEARERNAATRGDMSEGQWMLVKARALANW